MIDPEDKHHLRIANAPPPNAPRIARTLTNGHCVAPLAGRPFHVIEEQCKVLVVDDERHNADSAVILLQIWRHEAEAAYSADDALSKAKP